MMKTHSTNYYNTLIAVAGDCKAASGEAPPAKEPKSQARAQYELLSGQPYGLTSDDVLYETQGRPKGQSREEFFSKGQPCLRAAALGKRYGWGSHHNAEGKVALYGVGTPEYEKFANDTSLKQLKAMRGGK